MLDVKIEGTNLNPRERIVHFEETNYQCSLWERITNSCERIAQFDIMIYLWLFKESPCPFRAFVKNIKVLDVVDPIVDKLNTAR